MGFRSSHRRPTPRPAVRLTTEQRRLQISSRTHSIGTQVQLQKMCNKYLASGFPSTTPVCSRYPRNASGPDWPKTRLEPSEAALARSTDGAGKKLDYRRTSARNSATTFAMDGVDCATKPQKPVIYQGLSLLWGVNSCVIDGVLSSVSVRWCRGFRVSGVVFLHAVERVWQAQRSPCGTFFSVDCRWNGLLHDRKGRFS